MKIQEIYNQIKTDFEYTTKTKIVGIVKALGSALASRINELFGKLTWIEKQMFIETADKDYLYLHTGNLLPPKPALPAKGFVRFHGTSDTIIPLGTKLEDDGVQYRTENEGIIGDGGISDLVNVECLTDGAAGNKIIGTQLLTQVVTTGVDYAEVVGIDGGQDSELTEDYRTRVLHWLQNPTGRFSVQYIQDQLLLNVPTLKKCWVLPNFDNTDGFTMQIFIINETRSASPDEIKTVQDLLNSIRPANIGEDKIEIKKPDIFEVTLSVTFTNERSRELRENVKKTLIGYFEENYFFKNPIPETLISSQVYLGAIAGEEIGDFSIGGNYDEAGIGENAEKLAVVKTVNVVYRS